MLCSLQFVAAEPAADALARRIIDETGVRGGLVVHIDCGDGTLTDALRVNDSYLVHGLSTRPSDVAASRRRMGMSGDYGKVAVAQWNGRDLPYVDNLVNLLVVPEDRQLPKNEILRVLAPKGVAYLKQGDSWTRVVKPRPDTIDEWTHYLHDASNNAVAQDTVIAPPKHYQWIGSPRWLRHHDHMSGLSAMVSANGRLFYIVDLGPRWSVQMPAQWSLIARDAFSGVILWQRPIRNWYAHLWSLKRGPAEQLRRLLAVGDSVYVTLGKGAPVTALDAATGRAARTYAGTEGAEEMILSDGLLFVLVNPELDAYRALERDSVDSIRRASRTWNWDEKPRRVLAFDAASGRLQWSRETCVAPITLTSNGRDLFFHDGDKVVCLRACTGQDVWTSEPIVRWKPMHVLFGPTLVVYEDVVLFAGGENMDPIRGGKDTMTALSAETGAVLWTASHPDSGYASAEDLFVIDGLAWCGATTNTRSSGIFTGRDLHTGEVRIEFPPDDWQPHMSHHRCHRAKATANYILTSRTGIEFVDFRKKHWTAHHWVRGSCNYGILPCNGLIYAPPHSCACYPVAKLNSLNALAPERTSEQPKVDAADSSESSRLQEGSAYADARRPASVGGWQPSDWPTYRHDPARSGTTSAAVSVKLKRSWQSRIGGTLSSLVMADGRVFVADIDRHTVHALDAATGKGLWHYTAGGRVDSPPTVWQGRVLFGSADGFVYCLQAVDGALVWRFRAAPADRRLTAYGQVESVWPVHGSVLVREGVVTCVAGRAMWLDGGLHLLRIGADTGRKLSETVLDDTFPGTADNLQKDLRWPNLPTALPDVLSCDGRYLYMRTQYFYLDGKRPEVFTPRRYTEQRGDTAHLFSPTGFLDGAWWHRSYWMWGRSIIGAAGGWYLAGYQAPYGRILSFDDTSVYGYGRVPLRISGTPNSYHLFACSKTPELINPNPGRPPRKQGTSVYGKVIPTRLTYHWSEGVPFLVRALVVAGDTFFAAGPPEMVAEPEVYGHYGEDEVQAAMREHVAAFEGQKGGVLMAVSKADGKMRAAYRLGAAPVFDGMAAAAGRLFLATLDGTVLCLGPEGEPLQSAVDLKPGPTPTGQPAFGGTRSHPDFQRLSTIKIKSCELGYRIMTGTGKVGAALRKLDAPLTGKIVLKTKVRPRPGATPGTPGNAFIAFGDGPEDEKLVTCGFRISGQRLYVTQSPLLRAKSESQPMKVTANAIADMTVVIDLDAQNVRVTMNGVTAEAPLARRLENISWVGYAISSVDAEFSPIEISQ